MSTINTRGSGQGRSKRSRTDGAPAPTFLEGSSYSLLAHKIEACSRICEHYTTGFRRKSFEEWLNANAWNTSTERPWKGLTGVDEILRADLSERLFASVRDLHVKSDSAGGPYSVRHSQLRSLHQETTTRINEIKASGSSMFLDTFELLGHYLKAFTKHSSMKQLANAPPAGKLFVELPGGVLSGVEPVHEIFRRIEKEFSVASSESWITRILIPPPPKKKKMSSQSERARINTDALCLTFIVAYWAAGNLEDRGPLLMSRMVNGLMSASKRWKPPGSPDLGKVQLFSKMVWEFVPEGVEDYRGLQTKVCAANSLKEIQSLLCANLK